MDQDTQTHVGIKVVEARVLSYLASMGLTLDAADDGIYFFKYGSTVVTVSMFEVEGHSYVRIASTLLKDFEVSVELMNTIFQLNNQVLFGAFLLFEDKTISFSATLLGENLDHNELTVTLKYVAKISDDYDDVLQELAGGKKASDILAEGGAL